jgi:hypothetical protein
VGVLEAAGKLGGEALLPPAFLSDRAGEQAGDRVDEHHGGKLAAGEHVGPDRDRVGGDVLENSFVEALEARREDAQRFLARELLDQLLVELTPLRRHRHDPAPFPVTVRSLEGGTDDIDP